MEISLPNTSNIFIKHVVTIVLKKLSEGYDKKPGNRFFILLLLPKPLDLTVRMNLSLNKLTKEMVGFFVRYRERELRKIYPNVDLEPYYILWVDYKVLFPYGFADATVLISLDGDGIIHQPQLGSAGSLYIRPKKVGFDNKKLHWYNAIFKEGCRGVPFFFSKKEDMEKVERITCTFMFAYYNDLDQRNITVAHSINGISIQRCKGEKDYAVTISGTIVPGLMEKKSRRRKKRDNRQVRAGNPSKSIY